MPTTTSHTEPPPPAQAGDSNPPRFGIFIMLRVPGLVFVGPGADVLSSLLRETLCRPLRAKGLLCQAAPCDKNGFNAKDSAFVATYLDKAFVLFEVNHLNHGLAAIKELLESINALPHSKIGWLDYKEMKWKGLWPHESQEPFSQTIDLFHALLSKIKKNPQ